MSSPGNKFLGGYGQFVRRFALAYLLLCAGTLLGLLVADMALPGSRLYARLWHLARSQRPANLAGHP